MNEIVATEKKHAEFDPEKTAIYLSSWIRKQIQTVLKKRGAVVGMSGGIDSSVVAALCVQALGSRRVFGLALPERDSSPESLQLAEQLASKLGIELIVEDITAGLEGMGSYRRRDEAVTRVFPHYRPGQPFKITLQSNPLHGDWLNVFRITMVDDQGGEQSERLRLEDYLQIVAASNMKQRLRMTMLYYHAELRNFAAVGTGNKNEHALGFFVKHGDGAADLKPINHLFKTQVYQLARVLDIPPAIIARPPTTDTYPAEVTQEEFFFRLPFETLDAIWREVERGKSVAEVSAHLSLDQVKVQRIIDDILRKRRATEYLRLPPLQVDEPDH